MKDAIKSVRTTLKTMKKEMSSIYTAYKKTNQITEAKQRRYQSLSRRVELLEGVFELISTKDKEGLQSVFGEKLEYLPLLTSECIFSEPFGRDCVLIFVD